jgi:hypothetical protein
MEITLRPAHELSQYVWEAEVDPSELSVFGKPLDESGPISVIQVAGDITPETDGAALRFDHRHARVLNRGNTPRAVVIANTSATTEEAPEEINMPGDQRFLSDLRSAGPDLYQIGSRLLTGVRSKRPGHLSCTPSRYVETPDNFWAVKIQPRARSLAITVRGEPKQFSLASGLKIVPDRGSYSRFTISSPSQVDAAVAAIMRARRKES